MSREHMNIVIAGHVDHGKSTIIGRLLADTGSLPNGKLEQVRELCQKTSKPFEYAFLLDALKDEQAQGITIDAARVFFKTALRNYIILDAPGHIEFLKNMITGASHAECALLVIDAAEGVKENSRRHGYMLSMLGISQIAVIVNKMDLVDYSEEVYNNIVTEYMNYLRKIDVTPTCFIPVSGLEGENIAHQSEKLTWHKGKNVLQLLDSFIKEPLAVSKDFRMPVQDVYKFTKFGDKRRIVVGTVDTGTVKVGDDVVFYPSGKSSTVKELVTFNTPAINHFQAGDSAGFTLTTQIFIKRGEIAALKKQSKPQVTTRLKVSLFWLGHEELECKKNYTLKIGTIKFPAKIEEILKVIDASNLEANKQPVIVSRHEVAEVILKTNRAIAFDLAEEFKATGRFVIVDNYEIRGGGIIREALPDKQEWIRNSVFTRNNKWIPSDILPESRAERYNQKPSLIMITGKSGSGRKKLAKALENKLFSDGKYAYYLGIGSIMYGVSADIKGTDSNRIEHIRRFTEVAHILLDTGLILIVTALELQTDEMELIKTVIEPDKINTIWIGDDTNLSYDIKIEELSDIEQTTELIKSKLQEQGVLFKAW